MFGKNKSENSITAYQNDLRDNGEEEYDSISERARQLREENEQRQLKLARAREAWERESRRRSRQRFLEKNRKKIIALGIFVAAAAVAAAVGMIILNTYKVKNIRVTGNTMYTDEEIIDMVCTGPMGHNSLYLSGKYRNRSVEDIPFVEKMTVTVDSRDTITIQVYEKALAGYIDYLGSHMYFARDGTIVEASDSLVEGVPEVTGLDYDHVILGEKLPVDDMSVFDRILDITQLLSKYDLDIDRIYFDSQMNLVMFCGNVRIDMGGDDYIDEKMSNLSHILPSLEGKSGTVDLSGFTPDQKTISFREKKN